MSIHHRNSSSSAQSVLTDYPEAVLVSGFPFMLQGWNGVYQITNEKSDDVPVYRLNSYLLYWLIPIIAVTLRRVDGRWKIKSESMLKETVASNDELFGNWRHGCQINVRSAYTDKIRVSGLPLLLQGWNTTYYKTDRTSNGAPIYRLDPYMLYFVFPIIGITILKRENAWVFIPDCDSELFSNTGLLGVWDTDKVFPSKMNVCCV